MPLFMTEHLVITLNLDSPTHNTTKKVPNFDLVDEFLRDFFLQTKLVGH